jgi:CheY-like chemotaxis protein
MSRANPSRDQLLKGKHILVVEDHRLMGKVLTDLLKQYDHAVHATTGKQALQKIRREAPDIILLDLTLPDISGFDVARAVRQNKKTSGTPILAMSGSAAKGQQSLDAGCDAFILKPFNTEQLLNALAALLPK